MAVNLDNLNTACKVGKAVEALVVDAEGKCAAWRYLQVEASGPVEIRIRHTGGQPRVGDIRMTGRSIATCLHATSLSLWARALGEESPGAVTELKVAALVSAERATQNVLSIAMDAQGTVEPPPFGVEVRLLTGPLDNPAGTRLELLDDAGSVIAAVSAGVVVPLGDAWRVRSVCPQAHRLVFSLSV